MTELMKNFETNYLNLFERSKLTFEQMNKMAESNMQMFEEFEKNVQTINSECEKIEINNLMNTMLSKIEDQHIQDELTEMRNVERYLHQNIHNLDEKLDLITLKTEKYNKKKDVENDVKMVMMDMLNKLELKSVEDTLGEQMDNFQYNESKLLYQLSEIEQRMGLHQNELDTQFTEIKEKISEVDLKTKEIEQKQQEIIDNKQDKKDKKDNSDNKVDTKDTFTQVDYLIVNNDENDVKEVMTEMLNKIEFNNIYNLLNIKFEKNEEKNKQVLEKLTLFSKQMGIIDKEISESNETTKKALMDYNQMIDNKIQAMTERIKQENVNMWVNAVELSQSINEPESNYYLNLFKYI
jgi:hypothetical protein